MLVKFILLDVCLFFSILKQDGATLVVLIAPTKKINKKIKIKNSTV